MKKIISILAILLIVTGCQRTEANEFKFAVLSDVHVQDVEGKFDSNVFSGADLDGTNYTIRPMSEQMASTRLFNENYFAFEQALSDLADEGIEYVAITGDITDDGQEMNVEKVASILEGYEKDYGMHFYLVPGNHEPIKIEDSDGGDDFLKSDGSSIDVKSSLSEECAQGDDQSIICDDQMLSLGQAEMAEVLADFGYMAESDDVMWATPYSSYEFTDYSYEQAEQEMGLENRMYEVCNEQGSCVDEYDLTYAIEPVEGYIFLCLDSNIYIPDEEDIANLQGNNGFNSLQNEKTQILDFIVDVANYAEQSEKQVILFNHYPLSDFYAGTTDQLKQTFGEDGLYFKRLPTESITSEIAASGINLVFSGHMHYNATGQYQSEDDYLVNVMTGSTAAYVPSYKVVSTSGDGVYEVNTRVIDEVANFDTLFPLYETEYNYEQSLVPAEREELGIANWNREILNADNYYEFNRIFLETLVQTRHYPEWSEDMKLVFDNFNLYQMVIYSLYEKPITPDQFADEFTTEKQIQALANEFDSFLADKNVERQQVEAFTGIDIVTMFYKFLSARELAYVDYSDEQLNAFSAAVTYLSNNSISSANEEYTSSIINILTAIYNFANDVPSNDFKIDLNNHQVTNLSEPKTRITNEL